MSTEHIQTTYKWASQPTGLDRIEVVLHGYDASERFRY